MKRTAQDETASIRLHLVAASAVALLLVGGIGGWATTAELSGAVVAQGTLVVDSNVKKVQHPTGGVVGHIAVRDGDEIRAGDVLMRLDETVTRANLAIVNKALNELYARQARLEAEREGKESLAIPAGFGLQHDFDRMIEGEIGLFDLRRTARDGQKSQLRERTAQLHGEIQGLSEQVSAKEKELELISRELDGVRDLWKKNLIPIQRLTALERDAARIQGEKGQLVAAIAQARGKVSETELKIIQIDQDLRSEVAQELRDVQAKIAQYGERKIAAEDRLERIEIRAPQNGLVHQLAVHTVGAVIAPGDTLMFIVPEADALVVEAKVAPQDIDKIRPGLKAMLRLTAFNRRTTPELNGEVTRISADLLTDQRTGTSYYSARIALPQAELDRLKNLRLVPGMPVESFILSDSRTMLSYLVKPLTDQFSRAFREE